MTTLGTLVERVRHHLSGLDARAEDVGALRQAIDASAVELSIDGQVANGSDLIEIDMEQMRVRTADESNATVTLWPFGRGYRGTTAAAHEAGVEVRFSPAWPASTVATEINGVINEVYPLVYAVKQHTTTVPSLGAIETPADCVGVISVWVENRAASDQWDREDRWDYNRDSTTTGRGLRIGGHHTPGDAVRIVYAAAPTPFTIPGALSQDFATVTGLSDRVADLLVLGVAARLAPTIDLGRLPSAAADPIQREPGAGGSQTRLLRTLFQSRLEQEAMVLAKEHPIRRHMVR